MLLVELSYTLATEEAEHIRVDHFARMSTSDTGAASTGKELVNELHGSDIFLCC